MLKDNSRESSIYKKTKIYNNNNNKINIIKDKITDYNILNSSQIHTFKAVLNRTVRKRYLLYNQEKNNRITVKKTGINTVKCIL